jgi:hypothetical protein
LPVGQDELARSRFQAAIRSLKRPRGKTDFTNRLNRIGAFKRRPRK